MEMETMKEQRDHDFLVNTHRMLVVLLVSILSATSSIYASPADENLIRESREAMESADPFMGDWQGIFTQKNKKTSPLVAQVIALGKGRYHATLLAEFDKRTTTVATLEGLTSGSTVRFMGWGDVSCYRGPDWDGVIQGGKFTGSVPGREGGAFELRKVVRISPTLGEKPPASAVVLFDGTNFDQWEALIRLGRGKLATVQPGPVKWKIVNDAMEATRGGGTISTKKKFGAFQLHLEFRTPFVPEAREQARGNSGVLFHGLEIQVLDTYGLEGRSKEGGAIYARLAPLVNMCAPPMQWQTYDVTIHAPKKDENARLTVLQNGVKIHDEIDVGRTISQPDSLKLQDHGNPLQYRNIWLVELP